MGKLPSSFYNQSGVIPYKIVDGKIKVLLITSRKGKNWIIPKGIVEKGMSAKVSAVKEAYEEAGILGKAIGSEIGKYKYKKWEGVCTVSLYLFLVEKQLKKWEEDFRKRNWFSVNQAIEIINTKKLKKTISELPEIIKQKSL
ncbi:MAG: NUDIX hydrolase [Bacteroidetes bacterium]|nr:NUDIX hydrolase [Bacteroidota bacterium]MBU1680245.1 NUDIX hydrolase [Bacteroidota bacterium]MBU2508458.1 NUDIX hydrolase [Bacteroidota bacterium]